jgi:hypothetical protein
MWTATTEALLALAFRLPAGSRLSFLHGGTTVAQKRHMLALELLSMREAQWLLFVDADMTPPPDTVERLLQHDVDIVGAMYFGRVPPFRAEFEPLVGQVFPISAGAMGLRPVTWVGAGCLLVRRRVFEQLRPPWFRFDALGANEDLDFCARARAAGFRIWMDCDLEVGHVGVTPIDRRFVLAWHETGRPSPIRDQPERQPQALASR